MAVDLFAALDPRLYGPGLWTYLLSCETKAQLSICMY